MNRVIVCATLFVLSLAGPAWGWPAVVTRVSDGDTIRVEREDGSNVRIRLYGIDAPESRQPFGPAATAAIKRLVAGGHVEIEQMDIDRYGRTVAVVWAGKINVNRALLDQGLAWLYPQYCRAQFCGEWEQAQRASRAAAIGLWSATDPIPPWEWRRSR